MQNKIIIIIIFVVVCLLQLSVAFYLINQQEDLINSGTVYRFDAQAHAPIKTINGFIINITINNNSILIKDTTKWEENEICYIRLDKDNYGNTVFGEIYKNEPPIDNYIKTKITSKGWLNHKLLYFEIPYTNYTVDETQSQKIKEKLLKLNNQKNKLNKISDDYNAFVYLIVKRGKYYIKSLNIKEE